MTGLQDTRFALLLLFRGCNPVGRFRPQAHGVDDAEGTRIAEQVLELLQARLSQRG